MIMDIILFIVLIILAAINTANVIKEYRRSVGMNDNKINIFLPITAALLCYAAALVRLFIIITK